MENDEKRKQQQQNCRILGGTGFSIIFVFLLIKKTCKRNGMKLKSLRKYFIISMTQGKNANEKDTWALEINI